MEPLATTAELSAWMQVDHADLPAHAAILALEVATAAVVAAAPWVATQEPPSGVARGVCLQAAARVVSNPEQASALRNGEQSMDIKSGGFALTTEELRQLSNAAPEGVAVGGVSRPPSGRWPAAGTGQW